MDENEAHALIRTRLGEAYAPCSAAESPVLIRSEERAYSVRAEVYRRGRRLVEIQDVTDHEAALAGERSVIEQLERGARLAAALAEQEGRAAILNSRDCAIRKLHDSVGQALAIVGLSLTLAQDPSEDSAAARRRISAARVRLEECLEHRDDALPLPLGEALALLREAYAALDVVILVVGEMPPLAPREEVSLLPICQEAIANAVRHGGVSEVCFTWQPGQGVILEISNSVPAGSSEFTEGVGLRGMRRRALEAGLHIAAAIRIDRFVLRVQKDNAH